MTSQNPTTIEVNGKTYRHDPDFDCYYYCPKQEPLTMKQRVVQITAALLVLTIIIAISRNIS